MPLGSVQVWAGWSSRQPGRVEGILLMAENSELDDLLQPKPLYDPIITLFSKLDILSYFALV